MNKYYQPLKLNLSTFKDQFVLTKQCDRIPDGWNIHEKGGWFLGVCKLPVIPVENGIGQHIGWCIGYPVNHQEPWAEKIIIQGHDNEQIDMSAVDDFYEQTAGRFILILLENHEKRLFLDPYGSLGAVYSTTEPEVASTPTIISGAGGWDEELIKALKMPESDLWYPSGLTPKKGVRRLLANHYLNLNDWSVRRHWPSSRSDLTIEEDTSKNTSTIISSLQRTIAILAGRYPIQLSLTAGRDTRMLLACAREYLNRAVFFTFTDTKGNVDSHIASLLAKRFNLNHTFFFSQDASEEEKLHFLYLTGHAVSGAIWNIHKTLKKLDTKKVLLPGVAGGLGRRFYWRAGDTENTILSARELLSRSRLPHHERLLKETEKWFSKLSEFNTLNMLDLYHLEQRLCCWAGPAHYCNTSSIFELSPFNHRSIFKAMITLPNDYRQQRRLAKDICMNLWPELLELPFNEYTGFRKHVFRSKRIGKNIFKKITNW